MFDGGSDKRHVSLSGAGRGSRRGPNANESREQMTRRLHREREERERKRVRDRAATRMQAFFRGYLCRKATRLAQRAVFDKRRADIVKVQALLPADKRAAFVFHALVPMLRLLAFFCSPSEDTARLASVVEMVHFSSEQVEACNFLHLALADGPQRSSCLALCERLTSAMLRAGQVNEAARLLLALRKLLFKAGESFEPVSAEKSGPAIGQLLRRTKVLSAVTQQSFPMPSDLVRLCCVGIEASQIANSSQRPLLGAQLLSAPRLCEGLITSAAAEGGAGARECLRCLARTLPAAPPDGDQSAALRQILCEQVQASPRWAWFLGNVVTITERLLTTGDGGMELLHLWLHWLCWAQASAPAIVRQAAEFETQLQRAQSPAFVRRLLHGVDDRDSKGLLPLVLRLFFDEAALGASDLSHVHRALAFRTPFVSRIFPALAPLLAGEAPPSSWAPANVSAVSNAFALLGPPSFNSPLARSLHAFSQVYTLQLQPMYDKEFFGPVNPLRPQELLWIAPLANGLAYRIVSMWPDQSAQPAAARALRGSLTALVRCLFNRYRRQAAISGESVGVFRGDQAAAGSWWLIPESRQLLRRAPVVDLGSDEAPAEEDLDEAHEMDVDDEDRPSSPASHGGPPPNNAAARTAAAVAAAAGTAGVQKTQLGGESPADKVLEAVLDAVPHVLPFEDRVALLHNVILDDQERRQDARAPWAQSSMHQHQIRRDHLVEDGFNSFSQLADESSLREVFRVEFIQPDGTPESGIDGGGLFKEFMIHVCRDTFDPKFGLFSATGDQTLSPSPFAFKVHGNAAELYRFLGKVVGKAIYEMMLLEPQFSRVFLNRILGRTNEVDDVAALDRELHGQMLKLKEVEDVESLGLTFSVSTSELGRVSDVDLKPNGHNITVSKDNLTEYLHLLANFRTNVQIKDQAAAFVQGVQCVMPMSWVKMFDPYELNTLVSGNAGGFDVSDLRKNTVYGGGYREDSDVILWLWDFLENHATVEDMGLFLMFTTSCSRPPLLGFKTLYPKFGVHRVPSDTRLPTASTCANLLKLPDYSDPQTMRHKVTQAIRAECGFDLS